MSAWKMWQIICWFAGIWQRWGIQLTPSPCYTRFSKQTLCVGIEGQRVFKQWGKKESRAYDELLQIKWPKEVKPLLYCLIELIQNPNFLPEAAAIFPLNMCQVSLLLIHFLQRPTNLTKRPVLFPITGTSGNFNTCWKTINSVSSQ